MPRSRGRRRIGNRVVFLHPVMRAEDLPGRRRGVVERKSRGRKGHREEKAGEEKAGPEIWMNVRRCGARLVPADGPESLELLIFCAWPLLLPVNEVPYRAVVW